MICPSCGADVAESKFCVNCGSPLDDAADETTSIEEPLPSETQPDAASDAADQQADSPEEEAPASDQPTEFSDQVESADQEESADDEQAETSDQAEPADAEQAEPADQEEPADTEQAETADAESSESADQAESAGAQQAEPADSTPPTDYAQLNIPGSTGFQMPSMQNMAPNTAFVLVIVGLVLSVLFATFLPGLVCCIIGLVLNAGYNKKGLTNPHKTSTMVIGIIGIVIAVVAAAVVIFTSVIAMWAVSELEEHGVDSTTDSVEVSTTSSGAINVTIGSSSSASASSGDDAESASSQAADLKYGADAYHDANFNPTLYAIAELSGAEMQELLAEYNYHWDSDIVAYTNANGSLYSVEGNERSYNKDQINALPVGAAGESVAIIMAAEGYDTSEAAFSAATRDIVVEDLYTSDDTVFAVVYGSPMERYLVCVTSTDNQEKMFLIFTEASISSGLFANAIGVDAGSTMDEVWQSITGGKHIGEVIGG